MPMARSPNTTTSSGIDSANPSAITIATPRPTIADLSYPVALAGTLAVEVPLYAVLLPRLAAVPLSTTRAASVGVLVNVVSHPFLWFALQPLGRWAGAPTVVEVGLAEVVVWLLEAGLVRATAGTGWPASLSVAAVATLVSVAIGLVLFSL